MQVFVIEVLIFTSITASVVAMPLCCLKNRVV
jgi:hypothetical protein